ncbi:MAG TPA: lysophospholipid acyltransferase family protein, partial [Mycobacteriales bacterium]
MTDVVYRTVIGIGLFLFGPLWRLDLQGSNLDRLPDQGGAVLAITHFGYLDFALAERVIWGHNRRKVRFLATAAAFSHCVSGPLMRRMRHVPVDRSDGSAAYAEAVRRLRSGELVGVFPEAFVNRAYVVRACKTGAVRMAAEAGVPLVPVAVWGGQRVMTRGRAISFRERRGVAVRVVVGEASYPTAGRAVAQTEALRARLQALVGVAQKIYPQRPAA